MDEGREVRPEQRKLYTITDHNGNRPMKRELEGLYAVVFKDEESARAFPAQGTIQGFTVAAWDRMCKDPASGIVGVVVVTSAEYKRLPASQIADEFGLTGAKE